MDEGSWFARHKVLTTVGGIFLLLVIVGMFTGGSSEEVVATPAADSQSGSGGDGEGMAQFEDEDPASSEVPMSPAEESEIPVEEEPRESAPGIGDKARDGQFAFTVSRLDCGVKQVGGEYFNQEAQGQFCLMYLKVKNIGDESRTFTGGNQYMFDVKGREFEADTEAGIYLDESKSFLEDINPGNQVNGVVVFDVPKAFQPDKVRLHDSFFSGGVEISLR